jgi:hypothetical protein
MSNPGETLPIKRFALFTPPPEDPDFARVRDHLIDTVTRTAMRLRVNCAYANGISIFETAARITPDPDRPNFVTVTAYSLVANDRPDTTTE